MLSVISDDGTLAHNNLDLQEIAYTQLYKAINNVDLGDIEETLSKYANSDPDALRLLNILQRNPGLLDSKSYFDGFGNWLIDVEDSNGLAELIEAWRTWYSNSQDAAATLLSSAVNSHGAGDQYSSSEGNNENTEQPANAAAPSQDADLDVSKQIQIDGDAGDRQSALYEAVSGNDDWAIVSAGTLATAACGIVTARKDGDKYPNKKKYISWDELV
jgi:hypothetical protein